MAERYSREKLFDGMISSEPVLFSGFPLRLRNGGAKIGKTIVLNEICAGFPDNKWARVRSNGAISYSHVPAVINRWLTGHARFGVTDLHYIGTRFDAHLDTRALNDFNLLPRGTDGFQSQDSLVISTAGAFTDSHSDDHSGSNHCFVGTKIWLMWDTAEGLANGIEDVERCRVSNRAAFDMPGFLSLSSSRWLLISEGQTIFIPGHLTHKVITLEDYLGLGSFHVALPGMADSLARWSISRPLWETKRIRREGRGIAFITSRAIRKLQSLKNASDAEKRRWGLPYLRKRLSEIESKEAPHLGLAFQNGAPELIRFLRAAKQLE